MGHGVTFPATQVTPIYREAHASLTHQRLSMNDEYSNLTVVCGSLTFKVHKAVLCYQSSFSRAACQQDTFKEGQENLITLRARTGLGDADDGADDPDLVNVMMNSFYNMDLDYLLDGFFEWLLVYSRLFILADKYGIPGLQDLCHVGFDDGMLTHASDLLCTGIEHRDFWTTTIKIVFTDAPHHLDELRDVAFDALACPHVRLLEDEVIRSAVDAIESLSCDLLLRAREEQRTGKRHTCRFCVQKG